MIWVQSRAHPWFLWFPSKIPPLLFSCPACVDWGQRSKIIVRDVFADVGRLIRILLFGILHTMHFLSDILGQRERAAALWKDFFSPTSAGNKIYT